MKKTNRNTGRWMLVGAVALAMLATAALAQPGQWDRGDRRGGPGQGRQGGGPGAHHFGDMKPFAELGHFNCRVLLRPETQEKLGLSEDQVERIEKFQFDSQMDAIDRNAQTQKARLELRTALRGDEIDRDAVLGLVRHLGELENQKTEHQVMRYLELREILTPEQRTKIREVVKERRDEHREQMREHREEGSRNRPGREGRGRRGEHMRGGRGPGGPGMTSGNPPEHTN